MDKNSKILVAGGQTLTGLTLLAELDGRRHGGLLGGPDGEPDYRDAHAVDSFFAAERPEYVFVAAGTSGGIAANLRRPAELMLDNLLVESNIIDAAYRHGVKKLLYLASSCVYPRDCPQPIREDSLLTGPLEPTNEAYAVSKIAGIKLCQAYREQYGAGFFSVVPANAFGPGDDFSPEDSHVIGALIRRIHEAKLAGAPSVEVWGTGTPRRDFVYAKDLADACIHLMENFEGPGPINAGSGAGISIGELAALIKQVADYSGGIRFDTSRPDGMPMKVLDCSQLSATGRKPKTEFRDALASTYRWYVQHVREATQAYVS